MKQPKDRNHAIEIEQAWNQKEEAESAKIQAEIDAAWKEYEEAEIIQSQQANFEIMEYLESKKDIQERNNDDKNRTRNKRKEDVNKKRKLMRQASNAAKALPKRIEEDSKVKGGNKFNSRRASAIIKKAEKLNP